MTSLGSLLKVGQIALPPSINSMAAAVAIAQQHQSALLAATHPTPKPLGDLRSLVASITAWTQQDDDAHDMCSLVACRTPLHPGPCKGWKGLLHDVSPGTYHQIEAERVEKANARRVKRIADLRSQGKPIPKRLLTEIKPKPAPKGQHNAALVQPVPAGQVNQKADLAAGQAHTAGQQVSKAAGITPNTAPPLPLGPKGKKPSVNGRGPAFVITQPKVTDTYKLDKAAKITPTEWDNLSGTDKKAIRDELEAIKQRGFGPQQTKADQLLAKLPAPTSLGQGIGQRLAPGTPGTITTPKGNVHPILNLPGKTTLGQASKTVTPQLPPPPPSPKRGTRDGNGILTKPLPGGSSSSTTVGLPNGYRITRDSMGYSLKHNGKLIRTSNDQAALEKYAHDHAAGVAKALQNPALKPSPSTPSTPSTPSAPDGGLKPSAPVAPGTPAHIQHAGAVANRTAPKAVQSKTQVDAYGKLTKADFDALPAAQQKTIRDDLANAKAKFLDPKKQQAAADLLDRFGSKHPTAPATAPAATAAKAAPAAVDQIQVGHALTDIRNGNHYVITETPGKIKGYRMTSTGHGGSEVTASPQQMSKFLGLPLTAPAAPNAPAAKGYSDPMNEAVKAANSGMVSTDDILKTTGRLSPTTVGQLDDADRKKIIGRLAFIATHPKAPQAQKDKATALKRIIETGSPALTARQWDHTPTLAELHTEEQNNTAIQDAAKVAAALKAADAKTGLAPGSQNADRLKDLTALSKAQFDALTSDEQRRITDALQAMHATRGTGGMSVLDADAEKAIEKYTGLHPGIHRMRQAEADFRAGKIDADKFHNEFLRARVQSPSRMNDPKAPGSVLAVEAQRIAEDNPKLPMWLRAEMIDNPYNSKTYNSIAMAQNRYNYEDAPRLSASDITSIFSATDDDLKASHPVQAQAVRDLREHVILTGLKTGSPWSSATKSQVLDNLLHTSSSTPEISDGRLKQYEGMSDLARVLVRRALKDRIADQTDVHAKTGSYIALRQLENKPKLAPDAQNALIEASERWAAVGKQDAYRKLDPAAYRDFPDYVRAAIDQHLDHFQKRAEQSGQTAGWTPQDNPFTVMPAALKAHLDGSRDAIPGRPERNAVDIATYGTKIISPDSRIGAYAAMGQRGFSNLGGPDKTLINDDLDKIAADTALTGQQRFSALYVKDFTLDPKGAAARLNADQMFSVRSADPSQPLPDSAVIPYFAALSKHDYDALDKPYRDAIDARVAQLPSGPQASINATFHPAAPAASPVGVAPTAGALAPHVQAAIDTIYGVHSSGKSHTMAHQLTTYGALRGNDFAQLNGQEQGHLLGDLSFIATTAKGPSADKARKLIDRFTPPGTPSGQVPTGAIIPPVNAVAGQVRYATPLKGLAKAKDSGTSGDGWFMQGGQRVWGQHGAAGLLLQHTDPATGEKRYLMVQRGPAISDPGKWTFPGGASDSKETPHEGATRETIEELGLKDDVFKDAQVHGDFTYSIPGSSWKYTSVAASVPTMIKPNLTTAHARAETSDAKWMTEAEIKALDSAGKLHHPIAGGKLEKNVISLFPAAAPLKLGQVARPGPVTKRQSRLGRPVGGRQAPAVVPNAWPHPHKKSTGKNLVPDKAAIDAQRQKIKADRKLYDGKTADGRLAAIGAQQGFDDTPTVMDKKDIDRLLATGDYIEAWRGVSGAGGYSARSRGGAGGKTAADINEEMRSGPAYYGKGIFGNGYYLATNKRVATQYSDGTKGSIVRILIPKSAVIDKYDKVEREAQANSSRLSKVKGGAYDTSTFWDPGRWGAAKGLDGIEINPHHRAHGGGGASHVASHGQPAYNWLNRAVLILQKEPG